MRGKGVARVESRQPAAQNEEFLIGRLKAGDHQAFDAIFRLHSGRVFQLAYKILGTKADAEEAVQEVFLAVYRKVKTFTGQSQFSTWLYRLTVNTALTKVRRSKRRKEVSYEEFLPQFQKDGHHKVRPVVDWSYEIDDRVSDSELRGILKQALDALKPQDKAIVILSDVEGLSDREIGEVVGLTVSAVKTRLHRARLFLRGNLAVRLGYSPT